MKISADIQGNILVPFPKNFQAFVLLEIRSASRIRRWLKNIAICIADSINGNLDLRESYRHKGNKYGVHCFCGISFTINGLKRILSEDVTEMPFVAFREGAAVRSKKLGQQNENGEDNWVFGGNNPQRVDILLTIAAKEKSFIEHEISHQVSSALDQDLKAVYIQRAGELSGMMKGREHFGFKDCISQPLVAGVDDIFEGRDKRHTSAEINPVLNLGEFILGHPRGVLGKNLEPAFCYPWMKNGSFQVLMRLNQDVCGWQQQLSKLSQNLSVKEPITPLHLAVKLIGRWPSGTPLSISPKNDNGSSKKDFDYQDDPYGLNTPRFAHIRKMYPRSSITVDREWHRIIRRNVPFGAIYDPCEGGVHGAQASRGLIFNAFMASLEDQFEFLMRAWANDPDFPEADDGPDPLIGNLAYPITFRRREGIKQHLKLQSCVRNSGCYNLGTISIFPSKPLYMTY